MALPEAKHELANLKFAKQTLNGRKRINICVKEHKY
jgi:hypothetical protein